jgi:hypothetical protein
MRRGCAWPSPPHGRVWDLTWRTTRWSATGLRHPIRPASRWRAPQWLIVIVHAEDASASALVCWSIENRKGLLVEVFAMRRSDVVGPCADRACLAKSPDGAPTDHRGHTGRHGRHRGGRQTPGTGRATARVAETGGHRHARRRHSSRFQQHTGHILTNAEVAHACVTVEKGDLRHCSKNCWPSYSWQRPPPGTCAQIRNFLPQVGGRTYVVEQRRIR